MREALIECFEDTIRQTKKNKKLKKQTQKTLKETRVYGEEFSPTLTLCNNSKIKIIVEENTTFEAAKERFSGGTPSHYVMFRLC